MYKIGSIKYKTSHLTVTYLQKAEIKYNIEKRLLDFILQSRYICTCLSNKHSPTNVLLCSEYTWFLPTHHSRSWWALSRVLFSHRSDVYLDRKHRYKPESIHRRLHSETSCLAGDCNRWGLFWNWLLVATNDGTYLLRRYPHQDCLRWNRSSRYSVDRWPRQVCWQYFRHIEMRFRRVCRRMRCISVRCHSSSVEKHEKHWISTNESFLVPTLYRASRQVRNAPWPKRGRSAAALKTRSRLQAMMGMCSWPSFVSVGMTPGWPFVRRRSVITCNERSHCTGSPSRTIARRMNGRWMKWSEGRMDYLPSIGRKFSSRTRPSVLIISPWNQAIQRLKRAIESLVEHTSFTRFTWLTMSSSGNAAQTFSIVVTLLKPILWEKICMENIPSQYTYMRAISSVAPWPEIRTCLLWYSVSVRIGVCARTTCSGWIYRGWRRFTFEKLNGQRIALTVTPRTAESCFALSVSSIQVLETKTTGTFSWISFWMAGLATVMKLGPLVITPSISKRQAKVG